MKLKISTEKKRKTDLWKKKEENIKENDTRNVITCKMNLQKDE